MKHLLLLVVFFFGFIGCNQTATQAPIGQKTVHDSFKEDMMASFNAQPAAKNLYLKFEPNDKPVRRPQGEAIQRLLANLKSQPQQFVINSADQNEVQGEYGTKISMAPGCFVTAEGKELTNSEVTIQLKECYTAGEMLEENITTTTAGRLLDSRAAVFVSASCNGQQVQLKEGHQIDIQFPFAVNTNDDYNFFYGQKTGANMNWEPFSNEDGQPKTLVSYPEFSYKEAGLKNYLVSQLEYPDEAKRNELSANVGVTFTVDKNGKVRDVACVSAYKTFRDEITTALQQMPKWKPAAYGKRKIAAQVKLNVDFNLRRKEQVVINFSEADITPLKANKNESPAGEITYSRSFDKLGWINYSRYFNFGGMAMADVIIGNDANTDVKLVVKGKNAIAPAGNYMGYSRFGNLPIGEQVYMVALRTTGNQTFYCVQPLTLQKQTVVSINWQQGTTDDFKAALKTINRTGKAVV